MRPFCTACAAQAAVAAAEAVAGATLRRTVSLGADGSPRHAVLDGVLVGYVAAACLACCCRVLLAGWCAFFLARRPSEGPPDSRERGLRSSTFSTWESFEPDRVRVKTDPSALREAVEERRIHPTTSLGPPGNSKTLSSR